ncbi:hypothetical protein KJ359_004703 [Pestalotiopsis sp. 9143b]|nr:hypothetical protein KJ359_004703 [Pestalotiopsis sp. 9143b]
MNTELLSTVLALASAYLLFKVYSILTDPLNAIPGPWYAKFTELPGTLAAISHHQVQYYHALHQRYGSHVRVGPQSVFVSDINSFKAIHKIGGNFLKADYYHYFGPTEAGKPPYGLFQMTDAKDHAQRRKLLGRGFSAVSLRKDWVDMVRQKVFDAVAGMKKEAASSDGVVDVRKWWICMASDVVSKVMFGKSFDAVEAGRVDPWFEEVSSGGKASFIALSFPLLYQVAKRLPILGNAKLFHSHKALLGVGSAAVIKSKETTGSDSANVFAKVLQQGGDGDDTSLSDLDIAVEAASFMVAGTDTTSNTLTYLTWAVLSRPALQTALEDEVGHLEDPFTDEELEKLPLLHAVIEETLRLYGAAPTPLPRIVPAGGAKLGGYYFPGGTQVATQSYTMHRDPDIYDDPEK